MSVGIYSLKALQTAIASDPARWRPLVVTNGCFDLLHLGHVRYLNLARQLGQSLVIGLNSDESIRLIKPDRSPPRPIVTELERAEVLAALKSVDGVVIFSEKTACELVEALRPEIYAKGGDYNLQTLPEASIVQSYGGQVRLIDIEVPSSTTAIVDRILRGVTRTP
ncbi:adenylyltransferase/cytidyltransferase family protein [Leptolyngbya sp. FACHB-17]|uniref:adenylyltransferase/cytidyltransferase family protein n=1 Tax=unclassified Leptolyngbya TaxID=2650499 RepID=UPI0016807B47|nr:adenylyltransferase/cytidyltransferase family protein [Leptolyngbya sp. FACHB-17]MBD2079814.1 adenylyltransferase/cytidyltransferase family protein [Leptolyngbya sp. FACHB-17]